MLPPQIVVPFFVMPLFPAGMVALGRPKGHRLVAAMGFFACAQYLAFVVIGSASLMNFLILSALYGPGAILRGDIYILRGRHFIEMSNGDVYGGPWYALWLAADLGAILTSFLVTRRLGRWLHATVGLVRRFVERFHEAMKAK